MTFHSIIYLVRNLRRFAIFTVFGADGVLRSGWRFAIFTLLFLSGGALFGSLALGALYAFSPMVRPGSPVFFIVNSLVSLAVALVAGWLCGRYLERLPFSSFGTSVEGPWIRNLLLGLILGIVTFAFGAGLGVAGGGLSFSFSQSTASDVLWTLFISFLVFAAAAAFEEALFRGYILQTFVRSELSLVGVILTSLLFASVHNANPGATTLSWVNTFIAGVWFGVAYLKSRDLWLPFGAHLAWNWAQGSIFGVEVSGLTEIVKSPFLRESDAGPTWLTGGNYGIEGGVIATVALILSTVAIKYLPIGQFPKANAGDDLTI